MQPFYWVIEVFATLIENTVALAAVSTASGKRWKGWANVSILFVISAVISLLITAMNKVELFSYVTSAAAVTLVILCSKIISSGPFLIRCISGILTFIVIYSVDYIVLALMGILGGRPESFFADFVLSQGVSRILYILTSKACDILIFFLIRRRLRSFRTISKRLQYLLLALSSISFVAMQLLFQVILVPDIPAMQLAIIFSWTFVIGFVSAITAFFLSLSKIEHNKQTEEMLRSENALMAENYTQLHEYQKSCARDIHDFRHHLATVKGLALEGHSGQIAPYIDSLLAASYQYTSLCHSGNDIVDAIINCKSSEAKNVGIDFKFSANLHTPVNIDPIDLCGVLSNQLENAFDACKKTPDPGERLVSAAIWQVNDFVFLKVENSVEKNPFLNNQTLQSTKIDKSLPHGFGLVNIQNIAEKYDGSVRNEYQDGIFVSTVSLCQSRPNTI